MTSTPEEPRAERLPPEGAPAAATPPAAERKLPRTRTSAAFKALIASIVVLILLLIFILENTESVKISYFGATGHISLGVALLLAAVGGALLAALVGAARVVQIRRHAKRRMRD